MTNSHNGGMRIGIILCLLLKTADMKTILISFSIAMAVAPVIAIFCTLKKNRNIAQRHFMTRHVVIMVYALAATLFAPVLALPIASLMLLIDEAVDLKLEVLALFSVLGMLPCIIFAAFPSCSSVTAVITFLLLPNATLAYRCWAYGRVAVHVNELLKGMSVYGLLLERRRG